MILVILCNDNGQVLPKSGKIKTIIPGLTLEEMKSRMIARMDKEKIPEDILEAACRDCRF